MARTAETVLSSVWIFTSLLLPYVKTQANCPDPVGVANAEILTSSPYAHGDLVTYRCFSGFTMTGQPSQQCNNGAWQGTEPTCTFISLADVHEQTVDFTDSTGDDTMVYGMGVLIAAVFVVMIVILILALCIICRRSGNCCSGSNGVVKKPKRERPKSSDTARTPRMVHLVNKVMAEQRANQPAREIQGWKPFNRPMRDINTSTK